MKSLSTRNLIGFILLILSIALLIPGLMSDLLTMRVSFSIPILGNQEVLNETRSILGTIVNLAENGNQFVAFLILLFSILVPFTKAMLMGFVVLNSQKESSLKVHRFVALISKWSMADVFVVGVFIAFFSVQTNENMHAKLGSGFYFFTAYCIVSIIAVQLIQLKKPTQPDIPV